MEIIWPEPVEVDTVGIHSLKPGDVFTWADGEVLYLITDEEVVVSLNSGTVVPRSHPVFVGRSVRLVKGAFHVQD